MVGAWRPLVAGMFRTLHSDLACGHAPAHTTADGRPAGQPGKCRNADSVQGTPTCVFPFCSLPVGFGFAHTRGFSVLSHAQGVQVRPVERSVAAVARAASTPLCMPSDGAAGPGSLTGTPLPQSSGPACTPALPQAEPVAAMLDSCVAHAIDKYALRSVSTPLLLPCPRAGCHPILRMMSVLAQLNPSPHCAGARCRATARRARGSASSCRRSVMKLPWPPSAKCTPWSALFHRHFGNQEALDQRGMRQSPITY